MDTHESMSTDGDALPGLASSQSGYRIVPTAMSAERGPRERYRFAILGPDGEPLTDYDVEHERRLHLIVVRRDFAGFQHVHPEMAPDGTWTAEIDTDRPRHLPGLRRLHHRRRRGDDPRDRPLGPRSLRASAAADAGGDGRRRRRLRGDGLRAPSPRPAKATPRRVLGHAATASRSTGVQPYLGADGHLVVLREGDLAFLHAHPQGEPGGSGPIVFDVDYPSRGRVPDVPAVPPPRRGPHGGLHRAGRRREPGGPRGSQWKRSRPCPLKPSSSSWTSRG